MVEEDEKINDSHVLTETFDVYVRHDRCGGFV